MTAKASEEIVAADDWEPAGEGWEVAETNLGDKIVWADELGLRGIYKGTHEVTTDDGQILVVYLFTDEHGHARFSWSTPELKMGLSDCPERSQVWIKWDGIEKLDATRTINRFRVAFKRPPAAELAATAT